MSHWYDPEFDEWRDADGIVVDINKVLPDGCEVREKPSMTTEQVYKAERDKLLVLVGKMAPSLFSSSEGGGHDLGLWLDSDEIDEWEYKIIHEALRPVAHEPV